MLISSENIYAIIDYDKVRPFKFVYANKYHEYVEVLGNKLMFIPESQLAGTALYPIQFCQKSHTSIKYGVYCQIDSAEPPRDILSLACRGGKVPALVKFTFAHTAKRAYKTGGIYTEDLAKMGDTLTDCYSRHPRPTITEQTLEK